MMSMAHNNPDLLKRLLEETNADKMNVMNVYFNVKKFFISSLSILECHELRTKTERFLCSAM